MKRRICFILILSLVVSCRVTRNDRVGVGNTYRYAINANGGIRVGGSNKALLDSIKVTTEHITIYSGASAASENTIPVTIKGDGVTDDAAAINAYLLAKGEDAIVNIPAGTYRINSTIYIQDGQEVHWNGAWIRCGITNGDPLIYIAPEYMGWEVDGLTIYSAGGTKRNFIGVSVGSGTTSDDSAPYGYLHDIKVYHAHVGFYVNAYTVNMDRLSTSYCGTGFIGYNNSNVSMHNFQLENDSVALDINGGAEVYISNLLIQGIEQLQSSHFDGITNLQINGLYAENNIATDTTFMTFGVTEGCKNVTISNTNIWVNTTTHPHLYIDDVDGIFLEGQFSTNTYIPGYVTTDRTRNLTLGTYNSDILDNHNLLGNHYNYFPNSSFEAYLRGYTDVYLSGGTISQETNNTKSGNSAVKFTCSNGSNYNELEFEIDEEAIPLRGKLVTVSAWIYVPDMTGYENSNSRTLFPNIVLKSRDGSSNTNSTDLSPNEYFQAGYWNFWSDTLTIQDDATLLWIVFYGNQSSTNVTASNYIIIDDVQIVDGYVAIKDISNKKYPDAEDISATVISGRMILKVSSAPTDSDQVYGLGDIVWKSSPTSGASPGWVCTTAGAGGTAVFTEMANLK